MPAYSQDQVPIEFEVDVAQARSIEQGGMTLAFERLSAGVETAPLFKGLPDDACQSPHWGYVISGRLRIVRPTARRRRWTPVRRTTCRRATTWSSRKTRSSSSSRPRTSGRRRWSTPRR